MGSFRQIFYQIVFATKKRVNAITPSIETDLHRYFHALVKNKNCKLYIVNGMPDHVHLFVDLHPAVCLSDLVKDIKVASTKWLKEQRGFTSFAGWGDGYGAFTYSIRDRDMIINYIANQKKHHEQEDFFDEYKKLLLENGIEFDEKYLL